MMFLLARLKVAVNQNPLFDCTWAVKRTQALLGQSSSGGIQVSGENGDTPSAVCCWQLFCRRLCYPKLSIHSVSSCEEMTRPDKPQCLRHKLTGAINSSTSDPECRMAEAKSVVMEKEGGEEES